MKQKIALATALIGMFMLGALAISYGNAQNKNNHNDGDALTQRSFSDAEAEEIQDIIRTYLVENPEVIVEAIEVLQERQAMASAEKAKTGATENLAILLDDKGGYVTGADRDNARVAVVELFDYHCGFCKKASGLVRNLATEDDELIVAFREFPILREESDFAAEAALAARNQGNYIDFHFALMNASGVLTKNRIHEIAKSQKLDVNKLDIDSQDEDVSYAIRETVRIAQEMGVTGTPAFVVASLDGSYVDVISGFRPEQLQKSIKAAKASLR